MKLYSVAVHYVYQFRLTSYMKTDRFPKQVRFYNEDVFCLLGVMQRICIQRFHEFQASEC
jgi:hypothetical protein